MKKLDCIDKTDEGQYCKDLKCQADYFKCKKNGRCIPANFRKFIIQKKI